MLGKFATALAALGAPAVHGPLDQLPSASLLQAVPRGCVTPAQEVSTRSSSAVMPVLPVKVVGPLWRNTKLSIRRVLSTAPPVVPVVPPLMSVGAGAAPAPNVEGSGLIQS